MFDRLELLIGKKNLEKVQNLHVLVVGLGGVGGYVVESLVRSGVSNLILVDYDVVCITNKNRQIIATDDTIGQKKVDAFYERIRSISKDCQVTLLDMFLNPENIALLDTYRIDYIVDACDTVSTKQALISYAISRKIPFISCMGTGNRLDPSQLEITDLRKTSYDPLAKKMRKFLVDEKIRQKIPVICSKEPPIKTGSRVIASCSFVPSSAGLLITSYIIKQIIKED
ncbi:MAG: tRNA threonylcarbamoyladenosine dehydratase [Bacilli bacterium]|nr:tRNA threonylcarbamoyladenosine dehydratase [Bacilli bacterium]